MEEEEGEEKEEKEEEEEEEEKEEKQGEEKEEKEEEEEEEEKEEEQKEEKEEDEEEEEEEEAKETAAEAKPRLPLRLRYGAYGAQGPRSSMEDRHSVLPNFAGEVNGLKDPLSFVGVYDGHGGVKAAEFCRDKLPEYVGRYIAAGKGIEEALKLAFQMLDREFLNIARKGGLKSGAVLTVCVFAGQRVVVASAGDCRAVLCRAGGAKVLTTDHTPQLLSEKLRIEEEGGTIEFGYLNGALAVSRAVGDLDPITQEKTKGLSATPDVSTHVLSDQDDFLILACDGVWDVLQSHVAVSLARRSLAADHDVEKTSEMLVKQALRRGSEDNCTAVVVCLRSAKVQPAVNAAEPKLGEGEDVSPSHGHLTLKSSKRGGRYIPPHRRRQSA